MTLSDLLQLFRAQVNDEATPYLWQDEEVLEYIIRGQDEYVRRIGGFNDVTVPAADVGSPATRLADLTLADGDPYSAISPYIIKVRRARLLTAARDVELGNMPDLNTRWIADYGLQSVDDLDDTEEGQVNLGLLDVRENYVRWVYVPDGADTCRLWFKRLPYPRISSPNDSLELPAQYHVDLVEWMKKEAYQKPDEETYDLNKSRAAEAEFYRRAEMARLEYVSKRQKRRAVQYGGIQM
jgi:hypothetical protein